MPPTPAVPGVGVDGKPIDPPESTKAITLAIGRGLEVGPDGTVRTTRDGELVRDADGLLRVEGVQRPEAFRIIDLAGRLVSAGRWPAEDLIDVRSLSAGSYVLELQHEGRSQRILVAEKYGSRTSPVFARTPSPRQTQPRRQQSATFKFMRPARRKPTPTC